MVDVLWEVRGWTLLVMTLEVGTDGFFGVHFVFKLLMLLLLMKIPLVPFYNSRVCDHSG